MAQFLLSVCYPSGATPPASEELAAIMRRVGALAEQMHAAGVWVFGGGLQDPSAATVVTARDGGATSTDGPFIASEAVIGGLTVIDVADRDEALRWGGLLSAAAGVPIEVRPFQA